MVTTIPWISSLRLPESFSISPVDEPVGAQNPYSGVREVMLRYSLWKVVARWNNMGHNAYWPLYAHFNRGRGRTRVFQIPLFGYREQLGTRAGTVTLNGNHNKGDQSLRLAGGTGLLAAGDWIYTFHSGLPYAYQCVSSEVGGIVQIVPGLRAGRGTGASILLLTTTQRVLDTMEMADRQTFGAAMPGPEPGYSAPFSLEFTTAVRVLS